MIIIHIRRGFAILLTLALSMVTTSALATPDDDDLLLLIPAIISGIDPTPATPPPVIPPTEPFGLTQIKKAHGRWQAIWVGFSSGTIFEEYFRFDRATAIGSPNPNIFTILGEGSLDASFISVFCAGGLGATYFVDTSDYVVLCNWGFPSLDVGSAYIFKTVSDTFFFSHYFYVPSTGALSTGIASSGTATRISNSYKKVDAQQGQQSDKQSPTQTIKSMEAKSYDEYLKQIEMAEETNITIDPKRSNQLLQLKQILDQSK